MDSDDVEMIVGEILSCKSTSESLETLTDGLDDIIELLGRLADPIRISAASRGSSVTCLADVVGATPTTVPESLANLRLPRLVQVRREGTFASSSAPGVSSQYIVTSFDVQFDAGPHDRL